MLKLYDFSIDYVKNPTLIRTVGLRFGWKLDSEHTNVLQKTYRIRIENETGIAYDSGIVASRTYYDICPDGLRLASRTDYTVTVAVEDNYGDRAVCTHTVSTEILPDEWGDAQWIKPKTHIVGWAPYLRTKFETK